MCALPLPNKVLVHKNIDNNGTMVRRRRQSPSFIIEIRILINQIGRSNFEEENSNKQVEEKTTFLKRTKCLQVDPAKTNKLIALNEYWKYMVEPSTV